MVESWAPIIGASLIVIGTVITQLYIHRNTIVEYNINRIRRERNTIRTLFQLLQKYKIQGERVKKAKIEDIHQMTPEDLQYLKNYFNKYAGFIPESIHEQYHEFIKRDTYCQIFGTQKYEIELTKQNNKISGKIGSNFLMGDNLNEFQKITKEELSKLENKYSNMMRKKSRIWWLLPSWRSDYT